jgi:protein gp37
MSDRTGISYLDSAWNVVTGCTPVSAGCAHCYARTLHDRRHKAYHAGKGMPVQYASPFSTVQRHEDRLSIPLRWRRPRRIGACFTGDLFHEQVSDAFIDRVFAVMALCPQHQFFVLTKRPDRMREHMIARGRSAAWLEPLAREFGQTTRFTGLDGKDYGLVPWPLQNVWLGVSCEDQATADQRVPILLQTPAAYRWVSVEPMLGPVLLYGPERPSWDEPNVIDWLVCGGESGPGARPCDVSWIRALVDQTHKACVPVFVKQLGRWPLSDRDENERGGRYWVPLYHKAWGLGPAGEYGCEGRGAKADPSEWPEDLRVQELPR